MTLNPFTNGHGVSHPRSKNGWRNEWMSPRVVDSAGHAPCLPKSIFFLHLRLSLQRVYFRRSTGCTRGSIQGRIAAGPCSGKAWRTSRWEAVHVQVLGQARTGLSCRRQGAMGQGPASRRKDDLRRWIPVPCSRHDATLWASMKERFRKRRLPYSLQQICSHLLIASARLEITPPNSAHSRFNN